MVNGYIARDLHLQTAQNVSLKTMRSMSLRLRHKFSPTAFFIWQGKIQREEGERIRERETEEEKSGRGKE